MPQLPPVLRTVLACLGVVALVAAAYLTWLLTVTYRPIDAYAVTYQVTGGSGPVRVEYLREPEGERDAPTITSTVDKATLPWKADVVIPAGKPAKVTVSAPAGEPLTCVIIVDHGRPRERVLTSQTSAPGQPVTCAANAPSGETINAAQAPPTPR